MSALYIYSSVSSWQYDQIYTFTSSNRWIVLVMSTAIRGRKVKINCKKEIEYIKDVPSYVFSFLCHRDLLNLKIDMIPLVFQ